MRITIDNQDGLGPVDYSAAVTTTGPITIERKLNAPTHCSLELVLGAMDQKPPVRRGRVVVSNTAGAVLFTGYLATEPFAVLAGEGSCGAVYRLRVEALSDEWILNRAANRGGATNALQFAVTGSSAVAQVTQATQVAAASGVTLAPTESARALGAFAVSPSADWSTNAAAAANATYSTVRVLDGSVSVADAGTTTHSFDQAAGTLDLQHLSSTYARELANDVTLSGAKEAAAYVQEIFQGDGATSVFTLSKAPFHLSHSKLIQDAFDEPQLDSTHWVLADAGNHLSLTSAGLTMSGGNGLDGQTTLTAVNAVEMGGSLLAELGGVLFGNGSDGMLAGFYSADPVLGDCVAGFRVRQSMSTSGGVTVLIPVVQGAEVGTTFTPAQGHQYRLRLRLYSPETQRVPQRYFCMVDGAVQGFGNAQAVSAPLQIVFDVVDQGASSNTPATVLFDSAAAGSPIADSPSLCRFVLVNSTELHGSVASAELTQLGSAWVMSTLPSGQQQTRLLGTAGEGVDCEVNQLEGGSRLTFFEGRIPAAGERITVFYRLTQRAVARLADSSSAAAEAFAGSGVPVSGVSRWLGSIDAPLARSSADCEAAAQAVLALATARAAALRGSYALWNPTQDIWPGDVLQFNTGGAPLQGLVRTVLLTDGHSYPEIVHYKCGFANDWATEWDDGLGLKLSEGTASDALLPQLAQAEPQAVAGEIQSLHVTSLDANQIQIDTGVTPPAGGGIEVRRRDGKFGSGVNTPDLVLRSPVQAFSIPRAAQVEHYFIRMYDSSNPPLYSRFSSSVFVNWPADVQ